MSRVPRDLVPLIGHTFRHCLDWSGRAGRKEIWAYTVMLIATLALLGGITVWRGGQPGTLSRYDMPVVALLMLPQLALFARRLHDTGQSGAWTLAAFLPFVSLLLLAYLLLVPPGRAYRGGDRPGAVGLLGPALSLAAAVLVASLIFWAPYAISSGAMAPTVQAGDRLIGLLQSSYTPTRGDVVVVRFRDGLASVKRVIGLPGDRVALRGGIVMLNDAPLPQTPDGDYSVVMARTGPDGVRPSCANAPVGDGATCINPRFIETLPDGRAYPVLDTGPTWIDDMPEVTVPAGHIFVLGDNRDNSRDSRVLPDAGGMGMIPLSSVIARAAFILFALTGEHGYELWTIRPDRILVGVR